MSLVNETAPRIPPSTLPHRLRDAREFAGMEQIDLAEKLEISRATISNYERGVTIPRGLFVNAWAVFCDVDVEWLKTGESNTDDGNDGPGSRLGESNSGPSHYNVVSLLRAA